MEGPYLTRTNYQYGQTFFDQEVPHYNSTRHHTLAGNSSGTVEIGFTDESTLADSNPPYNVPSVQQISTIMVKSLKIHIHGDTPNQDRAYTLTPGERYAIIYVAESGVCVADGYLETFGASIPDKCDRYIGVTDTSVSEAYLVMDCSTRGKADRRRIYIASIRDINPLDIDEEYKKPEVPSDVREHSILEKLQTLVKEIEAGDIGIAYKDLEDRIDLLSRDVRGMKEVVDTILVIKQEP